MSAVWSPLVRTRFATDNVEVAHDLIARMSANNALHASGGAAGDTVAAIARRWGFAKRGHFASIYRRRYGVLPSHTLRR